MASPRLRAFRSQLIWQAILVVEFFASNMTLSTGRFCGRLLGRIFLWIARRPRRAAFQHLAIAYPEWSHAQRRALIRRMYQHFGQSLFEFLWLPNMTADALQQTTVIEGLDALQPYLESGRGVVVFTGHCGNWEWLAYSIGLLGHPVAVLQRERSEAGLNRFITEIRARAGVRTIDRGSAGSARELIQAVRRPGFLAFLIDQNIRTESVKVPFFGQLAPTPIGPAKLAIRAEAIAVAVFIERRNGMQHIRFLSPIECRRDDDPIELTAKMTREIEAQVRSVPEQWVWMHERWKERPKWDIGSVSED